MQAALNISEPRAPCLVFITLPLEHVRYLRARHVPNQTDHAKTQIREENQNAKT